MKKNVCAIFTKGGKEDGEFCGVGKRTKNRRLGLFPVPKDELNSDGGIKIIITDLLTDSPDIPASSKRSTFEGQSEVRLGKAVRQISIALKKETLEEIVHLYLQHFQEHII